MPHVSDVHATPPDHDRHDLLLVAAFAAGDLSGTDRDHAIDLTGSCAACAELQRDLLAIARSTATAPPPVGARPRDFQLTPADAARLRPGRWRRLVSVVAGTRTAVSRPLGVGLATLGVVGLVIGNTPAFSLGGSAATPEGASTAAGLDSTGDGAGGAQPAAQPASSGAPPVAVELGPLASAAASGAGAFGANGQPGPSAAAASQYDATVGSGAPASDQVRAAPIAVSSGKSASAAPAPVRETTGAALAADTPFRPLNILFALAIVVGLGLLVASRVRSRPSA